MSIVTRIAPSPTGKLHVGNIRTALVNWLYARVHKGKFILRIDDTDRERSRQEYTDSILRDMEWLGLYWDELHFQSKREDVHQDAKRRLIEMGRLYPCFETHEELELKKKMLLSRNMPPIYDRAALKLTQQERDKMMNHVTPHYRFFVSDEKIAWNDMIRGDVTFEGRNISDPVFVRADGSMTYMIATVADDIDLGITHIIRGEDHITNSAIHLQMFEALGKPVPRFGHLSLLKALDGEISKRIGGFEIESMRESGIHPRAIISFLAKLGTSDPVELKESIEQVISEFSLCKFSKAPTTYSLDELLRINTKLTHKLPFTEARSYFHYPITESFWNKVQGNIHYIKDVEMWWDICSRDISASVEDKDLIRTAAALLPEGEVSSDTWEVWTKRLKDSTGLSGKALFMPLRMALTGIEHGPELKSVLPLLGRQKIIHRLEMAAK